MDSLMIDHEKELAELNKDLQKLPDGTLKKRGGFYTHSVHGNEFGITNNKELIHKLCRKKYILVRKKQLENNLNHFNKIDKRTREDIIRSLPNTYQNLPKHCFLHSLSIKKWQMQSCDKNPFPIKKGEGYTAENGITFRTKAEYIIAGILDRYNIPYRYEVAVRLGKQTKYPDFTIKNPYTGKIIIWEHFGALHIPEYIQDMNKKVDLYMQHGYIPFDTLICSFETDINDTQRIRNFIENIILKG